VSSAKHIVFLMTDQHRPDYVGYAPDAKIRTPNIDRLAGSVGFTRCVTVNPICTPARTALLTGKYTHQIGTLAMAGDLSLEHPTYTQALQKAGYWTAGVGKFHWLQGWPWGAPRGKGHDLVGIRDEIRRFGFDYVWETAGKQLALRNYCEHARHMDAKGLLDAYRDHVSRRPHNTVYGENPHLTGEPWPFDEEDYVDILAGTKMVEAIRDRPTDKPMFLFGSFCCPHPPYDPPGSYLERVEPDETEDFIGAEGSDLTDEQKQAIFRARRAYKAMILLVDDQVGRVLGALADEGILDQTVLLFTSDHGEMLGDRGVSGKQKPWRSSVGVPCAIRHPDYPSRQLNDSPVEITDLTATMLDVAGVDPQAALSRDWPGFQNRVPCRSLMPIVTGQAHAVREFAFSECNGQWQMIQSDRWKYVRWLDYQEPGTRREELYDLREDPQELTDLAGDPDAADGLAWCRQRCDFVMDTTPPAQTRWAPLIE